MPGSQEKHWRKETEKMIAGKDSERERQSQRETETQWGPRKENVGSAYTDKMRVLKVTATLWKTSETWLGIRGCFGALLSKLPPSCPICPSDTLPFLFPCLSLSSSLWFLLSRLLSRLSSCPKTFVIPLLNAFFPSAQVSTCQIFLSFSYSSSFFLLLSLLTSSCCLCGRINSQRKCRNSIMAPKRTAPHRRLKRSRTTGCRQMPTLMPAKQKRTKTKPSSLWSASRPWR